MTTVDLDTATRDELWSAFKRCTNEEAQLFVRNAGPNVAALLWDKTARSRQPASFSEEASEGRKRSAPATDSARSRKKPKAKQPAKINGGINGILDDEEGGDDKEAADHAYHASHARKPFAPACTEPPPITMTLTKDKQRKQTTLTPEPPKPAANSASKKPSTSRSSKAASAASAPVHEEVVPMLTEKERTVAISFPRRVREFCTFLQNNETKRPTDELLTRQRQILLDLEEKAGMHGRNPDVIGSEDIQKLQKAREEFDARYAEKLREPVVARSKQNKDLLGKWVGIKESVEQALITIRESLTSGMLLSEEERVNMEDALDTATDFLMEHESVVPSGERPICENVVTALLSLGVKTVRQCEERQRENQAQSADGLLDEDSQDMFSLK